jgi:hypothetical protein
MIALEQQQMDKQMYWVGAIILLLMFGKYGLQAVEYVLMKLYEFFIQSRPIKI